MNVRWGHSGEWIVLLLLLLLLLRVSYLMELVRPRMVALLMGRE
jgi:hypothetical protein